MLQNKKAPDFSEAIIKIQYRELKFLLGIWIFTLVWNFRNFIPLMPLQIPCGRFFQLRQVLKLLAC